MITSMTLQHHKKPEIVTEVSAGHGDDFCFLFRLSAFPTYYFDKNQKAF